MEIQAQALADAIEAAGWSYADVGRLAGRARQTIRKLVTGEQRQVSYDLACRLLWMLDARPSELFVLPTMTQQQRRSDPSEGSARAAEPGD